MLLWNKGEMGFDLVATFFLLATQMDHVGFRSVALSVASFASRQDRGKKPWKWVLHVSLICFFRREGNNFPNYVLQAYFCCEKDAWKKRQFMTRRRSEQAFFMENRGHPQ